MNSKTTNLNGRQPDLQDHQRLLEQIAELQQRVADLESQQASARETEVMHTQLLDAIQDLVIYKDESSRILYANRAFREFYGMTMEQMHGIIDAPHNPSEITARYIADDKRVFETGEVVNISEEPVTRSDGKTFLFNTIKTPVKNASGKVDRMVAVARDITERKEIEKRVSEFYSMVSHELRTPLTSIRAALGLIEGGHAGETTDTTMDLIQIARDEADRLIRLINDILDIKKIEANKLDLKLEQLHPIEVIGVVLSANRGLAQEAGIKLLTHAEETSLFLGDRDRILQVLTNLVSNAIKFSPSNTEVWLNVRRTQDNFVRFEVCDCGPGISTEDRKRLFKAFQQIDSSDSRSQGGTGLGLAISKAIIDRHGGRIGLESECKEGSTFWFELPTA